MEPGRCPLSPTLWYGPLCNEVTRNKILLTTLLCRPVNGTAKRVGVQYDDPVRPVSVVQNLVLSSFLFRQEKQRKVGDKG